jgi:hypothetical protein
VRTGDNATANSNYSANHRPTWVKVSVVISKQEPISAFPELFNRLNGLGQ